MSFDFKMECIENTGSTTTVSIEDEGIIKIKNNVAIGDIENVSTIVITQNEFDKLVEIYQQLRDVYR